ncbi:PrsW family glutamic-type intramembrane protease [Streptococcus plurextorum]|uniref:PrsW family glutamic-type intramembrane protease n=1 Tax=Streptococcus plurextorum TaxID=456876 RepID=UPI00040FB69C|nr:PrsW family intramembrane metalloprotease [Streptococcus plurextorum]
MTKQEWLEAFETINGRRPSTQEFHNAKINGEFLDDTNDSSDKTCPKCQLLNTTGSPFCSNCGARMDGTGRASMDTANDIVGGIANKINSVTGGEGAVELRMRDLFSDVFKKHTREEAENLFACGSKATTPKPEDISREWPKPWYFARVFGVLLLSALMLYFMYVTFNNWNMLPGLMFVAAMAGAIPILFFYFECNSPRNIDIMTVLEIFLIGGLLSLLATLVLIQIFPSGVGDFFPSMMTGVLEEVGKLVATAYFVNKFTDKRYILNGLLIGGAVGAGFAVFETAGYIFNSSLVNYESINGTLPVFNPDPSSAVGTAILRGLLAFGGHVAWAAITGAGLMMVLKKQNSFDWSALFTGESLRFLVLVIILHGIWDMNLTNSIGGEYIKLATLCLLAVITIMIIINRGLKEINDLGKNLPIPLGIENTNEVL